MMKYAPLKRYLYWLTLALLMVACRPLATAPVATRPLPTTTIPALTTIVTNLRGPMAVDSQAGRLYLHGDVEGEARIVVLDAADGRFLTAYPIGPFALDPVRSRLYVDEGDDGGLTVFDTVTGTHLHDLTLPASSLPTYAGPIVDTENGYIFVFRGNTVYRLNPENGRMIDTVLIEVERPHQSLVSPGLQPISGVIYDPTYRILYLSFLTSVSGAGYFSHTIVSYNLDSHQEIERFGDNEGEWMPIFNWAIAEGFVYMSEDHKQGAAFGERIYSVWGLGRRLFTARSHLSMFVGGKFVVDSKRQLVYELAERNLRVYEPGTFDLLWVQPLPFSGLWDRYALIGHDPGTEQLYFVIDNVLIPWETANIQLPQPAPIVASELPELPVNFVVVSPQWPADKTIMATLGTWSEPLPKPCGYLYLEMWSLLYLSSDSGSTWGQPTGGLEANCMYVRDVDFSYNADRLSAYISGKGWYDSVDGGQLWQPAHVDYPYSSRQDNDEWPLTRHHLLTNLNSSELDARFFYQSPDKLYRIDAQDHNWVNVLQDGDLYFAQAEFHKEAAFIVTRQSWLLEQDISQIQGRLYRSLDKGLTWQLLTLPGNAVPTALEISPDFTDDNLIFIGTADGRVLLLDGLTLPAANPFP